MRVCAFWACPRVHVRVNMSQALTTSFAVRCGPVSQKRFSLVAPVTDVCMTVLE